MRERGKTLWGGHNVGRAAIASSRHIDAKRPIVRSRMVKIFMRRGCSTGVSRQDVLDSGCHVADRAQAEQGRGRAARCSCLGGCVLRDNGEPRRSRYGLHMPVPCGSNRIRKAKRIFAQSAVRFRRIGTTAFQKATETTTWHSAEDESYPLLQGEAETIHLQDLVRTGHDPGSDTVAVPQEGPSSTLSEVQSPGEHSAEVSLGGNLDHSQLVNDRREEVWRSRCSGRNELLGQNRVEMLIEIDFLRTEADDPELVQTVLSDRQHRCIVGNAAINKEVLAYLRRSASAVLPQA